MKLSAVAAVLSLATSTVLAAPSSIEGRSGLTPITTKGNAFFQGNNRFYIRGVDYQPGGSSNGLTDPIADPETCKRDIPKFKELGLNTIRVYAVDNSKNHDECMNALADAGIYLVLDINTPKYAINRNDPAPSYNAVYLQYIFATVEMFAQYDNTLAFFSGNEVVNTAATSKAAPWVKAVTRDVREYLRKRNLRQVPVGYSAADIESNRLEMAEYMNCGPADVRSDFFAFNDYSWCDPSSYVTSGWNKKVQEFSNYGIPLFLSEYGCNTNTRTFQEVHALYSSKMTPVYSGGLVYEYSEAANNYGLVQIVSPTQVKELPDFHALAEAFHTTPNPSGDGGYNQTGGASTCPPKNPPTWNVDSNAPLPPMPKAAEKYLQKGAGKGVGFAGPGSENAGSGATSTATPGPVPNSGSNSGGSSSASASASGAAAGLVVPSMSMAPVLLGLVTVLSSIFGASLILL